MKFIKFFYVFFLLILFNGCNIQNNNNCFSEKRYDIQHSVLLSEERLLDPWDILLIDSVLIIANNKGLPVIETYTIEGKLLQKFMTLGNAPNEVIAVGDLQCVDKDLYVYGLFNKKFIKYNYENLSNAKVMNPDSVLRYLFIENDTTQLLNKVMIERNYLVGETNTSGYRIVLFDDKGNIIKHGGAYPDKVEVQLSDYENALLYRSILRTNEKINKIALFTRSADMIDIFDISNQSIQTTWSYQGFLPHDLNIVQMGEIYRAAMSNNSQCGYVGATSSENYIYAIYSGRKFSEKNYSYGNIIRVMDWGGLNRFELHTDLDIKSLTVSLDDLYIYAIAKDKDDNPLIAVYNIGNITK